MVLFLYIAVPILAIATTYLTWFSIQLLKQNGRILPRVLALEKRMEKGPNYAQPTSQQAVQAVVDSEVGAETSSAPIPQAPAGSKHPSLAVGDIAPEFTLPDLCGKLHSFSEWRGRPILLIFSSSHCGFCTEMGPDLAALNISAPDSILPIVVTNGDTTDNQEWVDQHELKFPVLLQDKMEIANRYLASGTPMGYLVDKNGLIASEIAVGSGTLMALTEPDDATVVNGNGHSAGKARKALAESRIPRDGLSAGTRAPEFTLPDLGGREITLEKYRGSRVLLVFSDPQCGPCLELDPILEKRHRARPDVNILMVSRGTAEANKQMVSEHGLTFPLVLQHKWEISKLYAMFATPIAYLVDENGIIETGIGVGIDGILGLLARAEQAEPNSDLKEVISGRN